MDDGKKIMLAVWVCVAVLMIVIHLGAGNTINGKLLSRRFQE